MHDNTKALKDIERFETIEAFKEVKKEVKAFLKKASAKAKSHDSFVKKVNKFIEKKKKKNVMYNVGCVEFKVIAENDAVSYYMLKMRNPDDNVLITLDVAIEF